MRIGCDLKSISLVSFNIACGNIGGMRVLSFSLQDIIVGAELALIKVRVTLGFYYDWILS